ncbi:MAG: right-handed parallel beta-helix repeat-containing protein [bacterium]
MMSGRNRYIALVITLIILSGCIKRIKEGPVVYNKTHITNNTVWEGKIFIKGICTVEAGSVLTIKPGAEIEFLWQDENMDGIGESGLYIFGTLLAGGEKDLPIIFSSGPENNKTRWEGLYFMASEGDPNILSYCKFKNAYRALHSHFSKIIMENTIVFNNSRGFQFQESDIKINDSIFSDNYSALRFRDSRAEIVNTVFSNNYSAMHSFRSEVIFEKNAVKDNYLEGLRMKESVGKISNSFMINNRYGALFQGGEISINDNFIGKNELDGISGNNSKLNIHRNFILENGSDGVSLNNSDAVLGYNNIAENKKFNLDNKGALEIEAANNYWGNLNEDEIGKTIEDGKDDAVSGIVMFRPFLDAPGVDIKLFRYERGIK